MNIVTDTILRRQSCRSYQNRPLDEHVLDEILTCGRAAPSGSNNQSTHFYVLKNPDKLTELNDLVESEFASLPDAAQYSREQNEFRKQRFETTSFHYGAPVVVVLTNLKDYPNAMADCVCANENMMIAATSHGVGSCYINQLHWLSDSDKIRSFLGLSDAETICCALALGYMSNRVVAQNRRIFGNPVHFVE